MGKFGGLLRKALSSIIGVGVVAGGYGSMIYHNSHIGEQSPSYYRKANVVSYGSVSGNKSRHVSVKVPHISASSETAAVKDAIPDAKNKLKDGVSDAADRIADFEEQRCSEFKDFINDYPQKVTISDNFGIIEKFEEYTSKNNRLWKIP